MTTQLRSKRTLQIAGEDFDWYEVDPHLWELAFPNTGQVVGRLLEIPAHGRDKEAWVRTDNNQRYESARIACSDLVTVFYRRRSQHAADENTLSPSPTNGKPAAEPVAPVAPVAAPTPPRPKPTPPAIPDGWVTLREAAELWGMTYTEVDNLAERHAIQTKTIQHRRYTSPVKPELPTIPPGWLRTKDAAVAYGVTPSQITQWVIAHKLESVLLPGMGHMGRVRYVPPPPPPIETIDTPSVANPPPLENNHAAEPDAPSPPVVESEEVVTPVVESEEVVTPAPAPLTTEELLADAYERIGYLKAQVEQRDMRITLLLTMNQEIIDTVNAAMRDAANKAAQNETAAAPAAAASRRWWWPWA